MRSVQFLMTTATLALLVACTPQEEQVLNNFGTALAAGDEDMLKSVCVAKHPERIASFEIVEIGPESTSPFHFAELLEKRNEAQAALEAKIEENDAFLQEHAETYIEYRDLMAEEEDAELKGKLAEFHELWSPHKDEQDTLTAAVEEIEAEIDHLKAAASLSIGTSGVSTRYEGEVKSKEAKVRMDAKDYEVTIKQYALVNTEHGITPVSRWVVTDIREPGS